jgi:predicted AAA+ superfamily ATPase
LQPWSGNTKKRLVKTPKIYIRDSGLLHNLIQIHSFDQLLGHPIVGASWEGLVVESILNTISNQWTSSYYRSSNHSEIDLVLEKSKEDVWAIEVKRSIAPSLSAGFHRACEDIGATKKWVVYSGKDRFSIKNETEVIGLVEFLSLIKD